MRLLFLCRTADVPMDGVIKIEVPGRPPLAAFNLDGTFYVTDDTCTHGEASLSEGVIEDGLIECPFHQGCFEIATGRPAAAPCTVPIRAYRPVIERDLLHIEDDGA